MYELDIEEFLLYTCIKSRDINLFYLYCVFLRSLHVAVVQHRSVTDRFMNFDEYFKTLSDMSELLRVTN